MSLDAMEVKQIKQENDGFDSDSSRFTLKIVKVYVKVYIEKFET